MWGFFGEFSVVSDSQESKHKISSNNSGKFRATFGTKLRTELGKIGKHSFCNFSDLRKSGHAVSHSLLKWEGKKIPRFSFAFVFVMNMLGVTHNTQQLATITKINKLRGMLLQNHFGNQVGRNPEFLVLIGRAPKSGGNGTHVYTQNKRVPNPCVFIC